MTSRSIVGYDGSEPSKAALRWAVDRGDPVVVATAVDDDDGMMGQEYRQSQQQRGARMLEEAALSVSSTHPGTVLESALLDGPVAWALSAYARSDDLVVVGTHKTGFLHGRVLGSQSVEVAMLARCHVAVIPNSDLRFRRGVLTGIDDDSTLEAVVTTAAEEAARRDEELLIVHSSEEGRSDAAALVTRATAIARSAAPSIVVRSRVSHRRPAELILDMGRDRALTVIGSGDADRARSPIGTVLHDVLLNINAPTIVAHAGRAGDTGR